MNIKKILKFVNYFIYFAINFQANKTAACSTLTNTINNR
jgi:hypothetical protein